MSVVGLVRAGARRRSLVAAALGITACVGLSVTPQRAAAQSCSAPYLVEQSFPTAGPTETSWRICWHNTAGYGLRISSAHFRKAPGAPWVRVFWDARISEIFVPYEAGSPRYMDLSMGFSLGRLTSADCPAARGGRILGADSVTCRLVQPRGLAWRRTSAPLVRQGEELVVWGMLEAANYGYVMEWTFRDDGAVLGRLGATGENLPGLQSARHMHNAVWRLDLDLNGFPNDNVALTGYVENLATGKSTYTMSPIATEAGLVWDDTRFNGLHVFDPTWKNARGTASGYHLIPIRSGTARHAEPWTQRDFWVTRYRASETRADPLPRFVNHESVANADVVVWYWGSLFHPPRDEDGTLVNGVFRGTAQIMWTGWMLKPHGVFDKVPLFP